MNEVKKKKLIGDAAVESKMSNATIQIFSN